MNRLQDLRRTLACALIAMIARGTTALAQQTQAASPAGATGATQPAAKPGELDALVAPIALYPDSLLSQILMASTYPVEVVQADRWVKANKTLTGDALAKALEQQTWDPSVKSLVNFPDVLTMMSEKLDWTVKLGDAFIADQKSLMDAVQKLRGKAQAEGNLKSNEQMKVTAEAAPAGSATTQVITIQPTNPQVIYVPTYNPSVVYGAWSYPYYPPYYYYPPTYTPHPGLAFGAGLAIGAAWGYAWGGCNWGHSNVDIDIDRNVNINNNIDRSKYKAEINKRDTNVRGDRSTWQHDPSHRQGVAYRDNASAQKFGGASSAQAAQARDAYRGRADAGRQDIARGGADQFKGAGGANRMSGAAPANRPAQGAQNRGTSSYNRPSNTGTRTNAYNGINQGSRATQSYSQRGASSRGSSYSGGGRSSGGARGGGGGGRGGGRR